MKNIGMMKKMRCKDCPAFKVDGEAVCLLSYPHIPEQLADPEEDANYCTLWEEYKMKRFGNADKIMNFLDFSEDHVYFLEALARTKCNDGLTKKDREYDRVPVHDAEEFKKELAKMCYSCEQSGLKCYIYVTVNARNVYKCYEVFKKKQAAYEMEAMRGGITFLPRIARIDQVWYKACLQTESKDSKYFLLDIDTKDVFTRGKLLHYIEPEIEVETKNGYHWVVEKFDIRLISDIENVGVQKDGRLFIEAVGFDE